MRNCLLLNDIRRKYKKRFKKKTPTVKTGFEDGVGGGPATGLLRVALAAHVAGAWPVPAVALAAAEAEPARLDARVAVVGGPARRPTTVHRGVVALHLVGQVPEKQSKMEFKAVFRIRISIGSAFN
jgi:hypothetical protein